MREDGRFSDSVFIDMDELAIRVFEVLAGKPPNTRKAPGHVVLAQLEEIDPEAAEDCKKVAIAALNFLLESINAGSDLEMRLRKITKGSEMVS